MEISIQPEISRFLEGPTGRKGGVWESCFCRVFPAMKAVTEFNINHRITLTEPTLCQCEAIPPAPVTPDLCPKSLSSSFGALLGTGRGCKFSWEPPGFTPLCLGAVWPCPNWIWGQKQVWNQLPAHCGHPTSICPCSECFVQEVPGLQSFLMFPAMNYSPQRN